MLTLGNGSAILYKLPARTARRKRQHLENCIVQKRKEAQSGERPDKEMSKRHTRVCSGF